MAPLQGLVLTYTHIYIYIYIWYSNCTLRRIIILGNVYVLDGSNIVFLTSRTHYQTSRLHKVLVGMGGGGEGGQGGACLRACVRVCVWGGGREGWKWLLTLQGPIDISKPFRTKCARSTAVMPMISRISCTPSDFARRCTPCRAM